MRIISGTAKGRRLFTPQSSSIRPVADKVKGAIFNILGSVENTSVMDLFAGTGSVGLEALSRGALRAVFVDFQPESLKLLSKNIDFCDFKEKASVIRGKLPECLKRIRTDKPFDFVFVDPPYDRNLIEHTLSDLRRYNLIDGQSCVIIEHSPREEAKEEGFEIVDTRKYGQTLISFLKLS